VQPGKAMTVKEIGRASAMEQAFQFSCHSCEIRMAI
jgi:hypothetical protein